MPWQSGLPTRGQVNVFGVGEGTIQQVSVRTLNQCVIIVTRKVTCRQPRKATVEMKKYKVRPPKYTLQQILSSVNRKPIQVEVSTDGQDITMELDTGAAVS